MPNLGYLYARQEVLMEKEWQGLWFVVGKIFAQNGFDNVSHPFGPRRNSKSETWKFGKIFKRESVGVVKLMSEKPENFIGLEVNGIMVHLLFAGPEELVPISVKISPYGAGHERDLYENSMPAIEAVEESGILNKHFKVIYKCLIGTGYSFRTKAEEKAAQERGFAVFFNKTVAPDLL